MALICAFQSQITLQSEQPRDIHWNCVWWVRHVRAKVCTGISSFLTQMCEEIDDWCACEARRHAHMEHNFCQISQLFHRSMFITVNLTRFLHIDVHYFCLALYLTRLLICLLRFALLIERVRFENWKYYALFIQSFKFHFCGEGRDVLKESLSAKQVKD